MPWILTKPDEKPWSQNPGLCLEPKISLILYIIVTDYSIKIYYDYSNQDSWRIKLSTIPRRNCSAGRNREKNWCNLNQKPVFILSYPQVFIFVYICSYLVTKVLQYVHRKGIPLFIFVQA